MATFQEQMMKIVLPRLIDGLNNLKKEDTSLEERINMLEENVQELIKQVQELFVDTDDHVSRLNSLEAALVHMQEKRRRGRPRAKKAQDPVAMVEQAAQEAQAPVVETPERAMNEIPF